MKMVAAARLKRAEDRATSIKPYADRLQSFLDSFSVDQGKLPHPLAEVRSERKKAGLLLITSDKGLCGSYNSNVLKVAKKWMDERELEDVKLFVVGKKAWDIYKKEQAIAETVGHKYINLDQKLDYKEVKTIIDDITQAYLDGEIDSLDILYSLYVSPAVCRPTVSQLLPVEAEEVEVKEGEAAPETIDMEDMIIEPSPEALLTILYPKYIYTKVLMALANSFASEQGQRMVAMTNATDAAKDMVESLTLRYNKVRQAAITKEISEIVGGAEALEG